jgi:hypothetical protein
MVVVSPKKYGRARKRGVEEGRRAEAEEEAPRLLRVFGVSLCLEKRLVVLSLAHHFIDAVPPQVRHLHPLPTLHVSPNLNPKP